jgi:hypothetical protein
MEPIHRRRLLLGSFLLIGAVFLYAISFGPAIWLITIAEQNRLMPKSAQKTIIMLFYPHLWACYHSESYFDYIDWCAGKRGGSSWKGFRAEYERGFRL